MYTYTDACYTCIISVLVCRLLENKKVSFEWFIGTSTKQSWLIKFQGKSCAAMWYTLNTKAGLKMGRERHERVSIWVRKITLDFVCLPIHIKRSYIPFWFEKKWKMMFVENWYYYAAPALLIWILWVSLKKRIDVIIFL